MSFCRASPRDGPLAQVGAWEPGECHVVKESGKLNLEISVPVPDEAMARCDLYLIGPAKMKGALRPTLNGKPVKVRTASGPTWSIASIDLREMRGKVARIKAPGFWTKGMGADAKGQRNVTAHIVADRPLKAGAVAAGSEAKWAEDEKLPPQEWNGFRRRSYFIGHRDVNVLEAAFNKP